MESSFSCNYGYRASHHSTITCQKDGTWSDTPPICTRGKEKHIKIMTFVLPHVNSFNSILKNIRKYCEGFDMCNCCYKLNKPCFLEKAFGCKANANLFKE